MARRHTVVQLAHSPTIYLPICLLLSPTQVHSHLQQIICKLSIWSGRLNWRLSLSQTTNRVLHQHNSLGAQDLPLNGWAVRAQWFPPPLWLSSTDYSTAMGAVVLKVCRVDGWLPGGAAAAAASNDNAWHAMTPTEVYQSCCAVFCCVCIAPCHGPFRSVR